MPYESRETRLQEVKAQSRIIQGVECLTSAQAAYCLFVVPSTLRAPRYKKHLGAILDMDGRLYWPIEAVEQFDMYAFDRRRRG